MRCHNYFLCRKKLKNSPETPKNVLSHDVISDAHDARCCSDAVLRCHANTNQLLDNFSKYFTDKILAIRHSLDHLYVDTSSAAEDVRATPLLQVFQTTTEEAITKLVKQSPSKSCHLDPIPTDFADDVSPCMLTSCAKL